MNCQRFCGADQRKANRILSPNARRASNRSRLAVPNRAYITPLFYGCALLFFAGGRKVPQVSETIPDTLAPRVAAAVAWFNNSAESAEEIFKVTGILDPDEALDGSDELKLIMCGGDRCEQRSFRVTGSIDAWIVEFADSIATPQADKPQADLDPPPGVRAAWIDRTLSQHAFVVLLFYRGFW
jgi:hypothetical protein